VQVVSQLLPATHFMALIKTLFLAGDNWPMVAREGSILAVYGIVLLAASRRTLRKRLV
jgi:ABC-2 type transport system permease protein